MTDTFRFTIAIVLIVLGAYMLLTWFAGDAAQPIFAQSEVASETIELCGYQVDIPCYQFVVSDAGIVDGRGNLFACSQTPATLADMEYCNHVP